METGIKDIYEENVYVTYNEDSISIFTVQDQLTLSLEALERIFVGYEQFITEKK